MADGKKNNSRHKLGWVTSTLIYDERGLQLEEVSIPLIASWLLPYFGYCLNIAIWVGEPSSISSSPTD